MSPPLANVTLAPLVLGACAPAYYVAVDNDPVVAPEPPPEDLDEVPGPRPAAGMAWVPGYWFWTGDGYIWVAGAWSRPPARHVVWMRAGWVFVERVYRFIPGRWADQHRVPHYPYYRPPRRRPQHPHHPRAVVRLAGGPSCKQPRNHHAGITSGTALIRCPQGRLKSSGSPGTSPIARTVSAVRCRTRMRPCSGLSSRLRSGPCSRIRTNLLR